jgi:hypothetical protein
MPMDNGKEKALIVFATPSKMKPPKSKLGVPLMNEEKENEEKPNQCEYCEGDGCEHCDYKGYHEEDNYEEGKEDSHKKHMVIIEKLLEKLKD